MDEPKKNKNSENIDQRRYVTVLFSDLCNSTRLGEISDPEDSAYIVRAVKSIATLTVEKYGGVVTQFHGDGILAIFGYPVPREDDVRNAAEAALELHHAVKKLDLVDYLPDGFDLNLHTGLESGLVLISAGDYLDGTLELVGDAVNTAAGLCSAAQEGEIIASAATLRSVSPFFVTTELAPLSLKGKSNRIPAFKVLRRSQVQSRFEASQKRGLTAFCGRGGELDQLRSSFAKANSGHLRIVKIVGDPGMGKTRLIDEFVQDAKAGGCPIHRGHCEQHGGAPLHPFLQMLRSSFELDGPVSADHVGLKIQRKLEILNPNLLEYTDAFLNVLAIYSGDSALDTSVQKAKPAMEIPLREWFVAQTTSQPVVIVIDDWQWIDDASRNILSQLMRGAETSNILVILAMRDISPEDAAIELSDMITLKPITAAETEQIVKVLMPDQQDLGIAANLHVKSGGNPLFLEELCQSYPEWKKQEEDAARSGAFPATLQGLIESRVRRLPKEQIELAHIASVIGNSIPTWLLNRLRGLDENDDIIQQLAESDLIYAGKIQGTLQFKHGITRETIYATVGLKKRRELHNQIALILEELGDLGSLEEHYESLAYHHAAGANYYKAVVYAERAGDKALASSALDRARQQYESALKAIDKLPEMPELQRWWISISSRWALPCVYGPEKTQLETLQRTVDYARQLNDLDGLAHTYYWQGYISHVLGDQPASIGFFNRALETARKVKNNRLVVQVNATLGQSHAAASNYTEALDFLEQAIDEKRGHPTKSKIRVGSSYALSSKALVLGDLGDFEGSHACSIEAYKRVSGRGHEIESSILNNHGTVNLWQGRWQQVIDLTVQSRAIAEQVSAPYLFACASAINAYGRWMLHRDKTAIDTLRQTISWVEDKGMLLYSSLFYGWISDALVTSGNHRDACLFANKGIQRAHEHDRLGEAMACRTLAMVSDLEDFPDLKSPEFYLDSALQSATDRHSPHEFAVTQFLMGKIQAKRGYQDRAADLFKDARLAFARMEMSWHEAAVDEQERKLAGKD